MIAVLAGAVLLVAQASAASASGYIVSDSYFCSDGQASIKPPRTWTNNARPEAVFWSPILFQWRNNGWLALAHFDLAVATVNNQGYAVVGWTDTVRYYGVGSRSFTIGQPGYYAVANFVLWADGSQELSWATPPDSRGYCVFTSRTMSADRAPTVSPSAVDQSRLGLTDQLLQPVRQIVALYVDATLAQVAAPPDGPSPPAA